MSKVRNVKNIFVKVDVDVWKKLDAWRVLYGYSWKSLVLRALIQYVDDKEVTDAIEAHVKTTRRAGRPRKGKVN